METDTTEIPQDDKKLSKFSKWRGNLWRIVSIINVEPALLMLIMAQSIGLVTYNDLLFNQACVVNLNKTVEYCKMNKTKDDEVALLVADINIWKDVISNGLPLIAMLLVGGWSDRYGRKIPVLLCIGSYIARFIGMLACVFFEGTRAQIVALAYALLTSLAGTTNLIFLCIYGYISDTTTLADRTLKFGFVTAMSQIGGTCGSALVGFLNKFDAGYYVIYGVYGGLQVLSFFYILVVMKDTRPPQSSHGHEPRKSLMGKMCVGIFNLRNVAESFKRFLVQREGQGRLQLIMLAVVVVFSYITSSGELTVFQRYAYKSADFSTADFGFFKTFTKFTNFTGTLCVSILLARALKIMDSNLGILASVSQISSSLIYAFADSPWMLYLAAAVDLLSLSTEVAGRSMISKLIPNHEIGKISSVIDFCKMLIPLAMDPLYSATFRWTLTSYPGLFFFISVALAVPVLIVFLIFTCKFGTIRVLEAESNERTGNSKPLYGSTQEFVSKKISNQVDSNCE